jgi:transketolase
VIEIDGHSLDSILSALEQAFEVVDKPSLVVAHTVKGKGVSFMENTPQWHGSVKLSRQQAEDALTALGCEKQYFTRWLDVRS